MHCKNILKLLKLENSRGSSWQYPQGRTSYSTRDKVLSHNNHQKKGNTAMGLSMFFNELLIELKILPSNIEIVQDNAKLHPSFFKYYTQERCISHSTTRQYHIYPPARTSSISNMTLVKNFSSVGYHSGTPCRNGVWNNKTQWFKNQ